MGSVDQRRAGVLRFGLGENGSALGGPIRLRYRLVDAVSEGFVCKHVDFVGEVGALYSPGEQRLFAVERAKLFGVVLLLAG